MRPRQDQPGVVAETRAEKAYIYWVAALHTVRLALEKSNRSPDELAILDGVVVLIPATELEEELALDAIQTQYVISGSHDEARTGGLNAQLAESTAELIEDCFLASKM